MPFCPNCGKEVSPEAVFCPSCGHPLKRLQPAPPPPTERPVAAFVVSLVGGIMTLTLGTVGGVGFAYAFFSFTPGAFSATDAAVLFAVMGLVCGASIVVGSVLQFSENRRRVRNGSIIVLFFALVSIPFTLAGLIVGFVLSIIGAILGFTWKPAAAPVTPSN